MAKDTEGGEVVLGKFGGKHTTEHLIEAIREQAIPVGPALVMFENKEGDFVPIVLNLSIEELCLCKEILGSIIQNMISGQEWREDEE
jgi:hypothetical protein